MAKAGLILGYAGLGLGLLLVLIVLLGFALTNPG
jgi:hypothetical protein